MYMYELSPWFGYCIVPLFRDLLNILVRPGVITEHDILSNRVSISSFDSLDILVRWSSSVASVMGVKAKH